MYTAGICPKVLPIQKTTEKKSPSFIEVIREKLKAKISICSFTSGRAEIRKTLKTWLDQRGVSPEDVCIIVAEFGYRPEIFRTKESREGIDTYVFAYQPNNVYHFDACWWRNVSCFQAKTPYLISLDSDIATSHDFVSTIIEEIKKTPVNKWRPVAVHPTTQMTSSCEWKGLWEDLQFNGSRQSCESTWIFDTKAFKVMSGWPEKWIGGIEANLMNPRICCNFTIHNIDVGQRLCHVRHEGNKRWKVGSQNGRDTKGDINKYVC